MMANEIVELPENAIKALGLEGTKTLFGHTHELRLSRFHEGKTEFCNCCNKKIKDPIPAYCCTKCKFYIHICCAELLRKYEQPETLEKDGQSFHREHLLHTTRMSAEESRKCKACDEPIRGVSLSCQSGHFDLHVSCIKQSPRSLKHNSHQHNLFYFGDKSLSRLKCNVCNNACDASFYRCVDCNMNFHLECIPLPLIVMNAKSHQHPVMLLSSLKLVHDGEEYCCDICDKQGNAGHHVYYCDECKFIAHVECLLLEDDTSMKAKKRDDSENKSDHENVNSKRQRALNHKCHKHDLTYFAENGDFSCSKCSKKCKGGFYQCPECVISFHVDCIPLPRTVVLMEHTRHRLNLTLLDCVIEDQSGDHHCEFCKETRNSQDHVYYCQENNFFAHIECLFAEGNMISSKNLSSLFPKEVKTNEADSSAKPNLMKDITSLEKTPQPNAADDQKKQPKGQVEDGDSEQVQPSWWQRGKELAHKAYEVGSDPEKRGTYVQQGKDAVKRMGGGSGDKF